jgi:CubicO group peptidase (beta-lactamase class C family)
MRQPIFVFLLLITQIHPAFGQPANSRLSGLDTAIARILNDWHCAGAAIAIVEKDKIIFTAGYGYANWEQKTPVTANTYFAAGSCTKPFTCALLGILQEEGKLNFDQPITQYLQQLQFANATLNAQATTRDLMTHRTGLPRHDLSWAIFGASGTDSLLQKIKHHQPVAPLRQKWGYNNFMYATLGKLSETLSGKKYTAALTEKILQPLGIAAINFSVDSMQQTKDFAYGYTTDASGHIVKLPYVNLDMMSSVGGINTTVAEMAKWLIPWLNDGKYKGRQILPAHYVKEAISNHMVVGSGLPSQKNPEVHFQNYGLGWFLSSYRGHYRVEHGGNIAGFSTNQIFFPTDGVGLVIFCNQENSNNKVMAAIRNLIADRMLNLPYKDWQSILYAPVKNQMQAAVLQPPKKNQQQQAEPKLALNRPAGEYEGLFEEPGYGYLHITYRQDTLHAIAGKNRFWLKHFKQEVFDAIPSDDTTQANHQPVFRMVFYSDEQGEVTAAAIRLEPEQQLPTIFEKRLLAMPPNSVQLKNFSGTYQMGNMLVTLSVKNERQLFMTVSGQPPYELMAISANKLIIKDMPAYQMVFVNKDEFTWTQPGASLNAIRKKEL